MIRFDFMNERHKQCHVGLTRRGLTRPTAVYATTHHEIITSRMGAEEVQGPSAQGVAQKRTVLGKNRLGRQDTPVQSKPCRAKEPITVATLDDVRTIFKSLLKEYAYWVDDAWVTGTIPPELYGTYFRNGPALHVTNPRYQRHALDGDGMIFSIAFKDGRAFFRNRFVRTKGFVEEQAAGRPLFRSSFSRGAVDGRSPLFNPFDLEFKNVANTGVLPWAGNLYALWEAGLPHLVDPASLDTYRETRIAGQVRGNSLAAHYRIVHERQQQVSAEDPGEQKPGQQQQQHHRAQEPHQRLHDQQHQQQVVMNRAAPAQAGCGRRLVTFTNDFGWTGARAVFYEFEEDGELLHQTEHKLEGVDVALIHDLLVTEHYYVLVLGPMKVDPAKFATEYMFGKCSVAECLVFNKQQPSRVMLFPRPGRPSGRMLSPRVLSTEPLFVFHHVNGFEAEDGAVLVLDCVAWDEVSFDMDLYNPHIKSVDCFVGGTRTQLTRLTCDLRTGAVERRKLLQRTVEFPATDPRVTSRPHRVAWFIADTIDDPVLWGPAQSLVRVELDTGLTLSPRAAASLTLAQENTLAPPRRAVGAAVGSDASAAPGVAVDTWHVGARSFPGEPMFIPRPGSDREGDGWLLVVVHDAATERAAVHILDAEDLSAGPVATLQLPHGLSVGLHGAWEPLYRGPEAGDPQVAAWQEVGQVRPL